MVVPFARSVLTGPATMAMLQSCLKDSARSLTPEQQHAVATALEAANNSSATGVGGPLFVRLLCERSRRWRSSDSAAGLRVPANNEALVFECLDNLEQRYVVLSKVQMKNSECGINQLEKIAN